MKTQRLHLFNNKLYGKWHKGNYFVFPQSQKGKFITEEKKNI